MPCTLAWAAAGSAAMRSSRTEPAWFLSQFRSTVLIGSKGLGRATGGSDGGGGWPCAGGGWPCAGGWFGGDHCPGAGWFGGYCAGGACPGGYWPGGYWPGGSWPGGGWY